MTMYRKKPVVVEAFQMTMERRIDNSEWPAWLHMAWQLPADEPGALFCCRDCDEPGKKCTPLFIRAEGGSYKIEWDDWLVRGSASLSILKPDIFEATYEPVEPETVPALARATE